MEKHPVALEANRIIDSLGGTGDVARLFDIEPAAVSQWRRNGIPRPRMHFLRFTRPDLFPPRDVHQDAAVHKESIGAVVDQST